MWQVYEGSSLETRGSALVRVLHRKTFSRREEAMQYAELLRVQKANQGNAAMAISAALREEAVAADAILKPFGVSLVEAAKEVATRLSLVKKSRDVAGVVEDYLSAITADGHRERYIQDLRSRLGRFAHDFDATSMASIDVSILEAWLRGLRVSGATRNIYRTRLVSLYVYALDRGWVAINPAVKLKIAKKKPSPIGILKPEQFARLLVNASAETLPYHAIAGFAGVRSAELERMSWEDVHFDSGLIEVGTAKSKTASRRFIAIQPALREWLRPYQNHRGPICPTKGTMLYRLLTADRRAAAIAEWPTNASRHSFASYHLAHFQNAAQLALEMGHTSANIIFAHYRELVRPEEARKWWQIMPAVGAQNVVSIAS
jgi:integrase